VNSVVSPLPRIGARVAPSGSLVRQSSRLLPSLFSQLDASRRITVLEVGPAAPETISFFGQFRSCLHIKDLYEEPLVREEHQDLDEQELKQGFLDLLGFPRGTLIDICLFWDFLNYLTPKALRAFNAALKPYLHGGTRGHGFSVLNVETPLSNRQYGLAEYDTLCSRPARLEQLSYYPHSHSELDRCLASFQIARGWLLSDGRLEMLLEARL
jgi:hypothetical protein